MKAINFCSDKKSHVDYFIVYKLDRFARNQVDHITVRETLKKYKTELKSVTEPISDICSGKMMESMLSAFAEFDNNIRTERSVNGMRERIKQGVWVWQSPIGYYRTEKKANISPDPKFAPYIRTIFEEYSKDSFAQRHGVRLGLNLACDIRGIQQRFRIKEKRRTSRPERRVQQARGIPGGRGHDNIYAGHVCRATPASDYETDPGRVDSHRRRS